MIDQKEMFRKIGEIINELNDQYKYLSENPENLKGLEMELFAANANFLADHIRIIQKMNKPEPAEKDSEKTDGSEEKQELPGKREDAEPVAESESKPNEENKQPEKSGIEELTFHLEEEHTKEPHEEEAAPEVKKSESAEEVVINEVVINERTVSLDTPTPTLNDVMSAQLKQNTMAGKFNKVPVTDLKALINLNDKLLFIKDLFKGYSLAYSEAIELLNRFDNFDSADNFLKTNYSVKNSWSEKQQTVDKFYEILNRRFVK